MVMANTPDVLRNCKACLDACLLHILNLRGFAQTVMVDTWICSLSYVFISLTCFPLYYGVPYKGIMLMML